MLCTGRMLCCCRLRMETWQSPSRHTILKTAPARRRCWTTTRCAKTNNHTVREAACTCIGELAAKVPAEAVAPQVPRMLRGLATCLREQLAGAPGRPQSASAFLRREV